MYKYQNSSIITSLRSIGATQAFLHSITESTTDKVLKENIYSSNNNLQLLIKDKGWILRNPVLQ